MPRRGGGPGPRPWRRSSGRRRRRRRRAARSRRLAISVPDGHASTNSGRPVDRKDAQLRRLARRWAAACSQPQRLRGAPGAARPRLSSRVRATTSAGVSRSRASEAAPRPRTGRRPRGRRRRGGRGCPRRRRAGSRRAGRGRGRWSRCRGGRGRRDVARRNAGQQAVELAWVEQRAVAGEEHDAAGAELARRARSRPVRPPSGRRSAGREAPRRRSPRELGGAGLAADDDRPLDRPRRADRLQHVFEHRRDQRLAPLVLDARRRVAASPRRSASPGVPRSLSTSQTGESKTSQGRGDEVGRVVEHDARQPGSRRRRPSISVGAARVGISSGGGSGSPSSTTIASISPA